MRGFRLVVYGVLIVSVSSCFHPAPFDENQWRRKVASQEVEKLYAPHFKDGRYFAPWMPMQRGGFWRLARWKFSRKADYTDEERSYRPTFIPNLKERIRSMPGGDFIAWIGHSTFLMRLGGGYWLIDPIFSTRALLPKRVTPPAITAEDLRELGVQVNVLISHNHYDHLDKASILSLPGDSRIFVPLGLGDYVGSFHDGTVRELDWWDKVDAGYDTTLTCLPAQHWSRRIGQPANSTLWASYMLMTPKATIYYGADSGYFVGYREFGRRFPGIDYALLSTTAYHPRWFMHYAHKDIPEVLDAFRDLGAMYFIPTQWGTFHLGDEPPGYPALDLKRHIKERNLDPSRFIIMDIGQIETIVHGSTRDK